MKFKPSAQELAVVVEVFDRAKADGCPYGGDGEVQAPVAVRRWHSFYRRHTRGSAEDRILDLVDGLVARFEPERLNWPLARIEYSHIAGEIDRVLASMQKR